MYKKRFQIQKFTLVLQGAVIGDGNTFLSWIKYSGNLQNLEIGDNNIFSNNVTLILKDKIIIGHNNHFSSNVIISTSKLSKDHKEHICYPIRIGNNNWFASNSLISISKSELCIGNGITLGAYSVLFESPTIVGTYLGIPAILQGSQ